ncbi:hypothetical protein [Brevibacterium jeotgali]|uniref:Uncharacterized protein n=1 Tax=Brevibacterium jeotgali TaxID=1262550 RepID=A0A2H1L3D6_9MICO|nr:hypothetical protein [Brevibacterium jeotgali]TWC01672.1 hypothetical protein FB108_0324 [Brevibacterium jeotgali]SMY11417.1 hypothetical protein BJEO58_01002 [Brevibacterium jeotgali]
MTRLKIYSKPRGAGDQTSGGRGKLLRSASDLTRVQVLVRETLQNSWDAKLDEWVPAYGVYVRKPSAEAKRTLAEDVFTEVPPSLEVLRTSLAHPETRVMEIYDRGTTGLDGPVHAGEATDPGAPNNFNSFVFDIGTTKSDGSAGGTFGFGKTATFEVSHAHSVVYCSVCKNDEGQVEHRLIASALHDPYDEDGARFTGAHWWGDPNHDEIVPLRGDEARAIGERLFQTSFSDEDEETGTSILVIDPEVRVSLRDESATERVQVHDEVLEDLLVDEVVKSLAENAWPKAISTGGEFPPMIFHVYKRDEEIEVAEIIREGFDRYAASLTEVREQLSQLEGDAPPRSLQILKEKLEPITLRPARSFTESRETFFGDRRDNVAGYLHLMITLDESTGCKPGDRRALSAPKNRLCLMRSGPELVVYYYPVVDVELPGLQWTGVFKPTPECDHHFASSEPPTHDTWTPNTADTEVSAYMVRRTLDAIKKKTRTFLEVQKVEQSAESRSVRDVANALRGFVPLGRQEPGPERETSGRKPSRRRTAAASARPRVEVIDYHAAPDGHGFTVQFHLEASTDAQYVVRAKPAAQTADGSMLLEDREYSVTWSGADPSRPRHREAVYRGGAQGELKINTLSAIALDLAIDLEEAS